MDAEDKAFLQFLKDASDYFTGRTSREQFLANQKNWRAAAPPMLAFQYDLLTLREQLLATTGYEERKQVQQKIIEVADQAVRMKDAPSSFRQRVQLSVLEVQAEQISGQIGLDLLFIRNPDPVVWKHVFAGRNPKEVLNDHLEQWKNWEAEAKKLLEETNGDAHGPLYCEIAIAVNLGRIGLARQMILLTHITGKAELAPPLPSSVPDGLKRLSALADKLGQLEIKLRAELLLAQALDLQGQLDEAMAVAQRVLPIAAAHQYAHIEQTAKEFLEGKLSVKATISQLEHIRDKDGLDLFLMITENNIEDFARHTCETLNIPLERAPVVAQEIAGQRFLAQIQQSWCRYLEVADYLKHVPSTETLYEKRPDKVCLCSPRGLESAISHEATEELIIAFKKTHCTNCTTREPKNAAKASRIK
jgi:hypothetical protein